MIKVSLPIQAVWCHCLCYLILHIASHIQDHEWLSLLGLSLSVLGTVSRSPLACLFPPLHWGRMWVSAVGIPQPFLSPKFAAFQLCSCPLDRALSVPWRWGFCRFVQTQPLPSACCFPAWCSEGGAGHWGCVYSRVMDMYFLCPAADPNFSTQVLLGQMTVGYIITF